MLIYNLELCIVLKANFTQKILMKSWSTHPNVDRKSDVIS